MVRRFFTEYAKQQLLLSGFKTDGKDWGFDNHYQFFKFHKKDGYVWLLKNYNPHSENIACMIGDPDDGGHNPNIISVACSYGNGTWITQNMNVELLLEMICNNEPETWIKNFSEYETNRILGVLND